MKRFLKFALGSFESFLDFTPKPNFNSTYQYDQSDEQAIQACWREVGDCLRFAINKFEEENAEEIKESIKNQETA